MAGTSDSTKDAGQPSTISPMRRCAAVLLAACVILAGCGGDGGTESSDRATSSDTASAPVLPNGRATTTTTALEAASLGAVTGTMRTPAGDPVEFTGELLARIDGVNTDGSCSAADLPVDSDLLVVRSTWRNPNQFSIVAMPLAYQLVGASESITPARSPTNFTLPFLFSRGPGPHSLEDCIPLLADLQPWAGEEIGRFPSDVGAHELDPDESAVSLDVIAIPPPAQLLYDRLEVSGPADGSDPGLPPGCTVDQSSRAGAQDRATCVIANL